MKVKSFWLDKKAFIVMCTLLTLNLLVIAFIIICSVLWADLESRKSLIGLLACFTFTLVLLILVLTINPCSRRSGCKNTFSRIVFSNEDMYVCVGKHVFQRIRYDEVKYMLICDKSYATWSSRVKDVLLVISALPSLNPDRDYSILTVEKSVIVCRYNKKLFAELKLRLEHSGNTTYRTG